MKLHGSCVIVTGGASGMGEATARSLVSRGARVVVADIQDERGQCLAEELGDNGAFLHTDVTSESDVARAVDHAVATWGSLDGLVNNAGILGAIGPIDLTPVEEWDRTMTVLLRSVFLGTKHAARVMKVQRSGAIVNVASIAAFRGGIGPHAYAASKAGIVSLTRNTAAELGHFGVRVNCIAPGRTATPMVADAWVGDPSDLAAAEQALLDETPLADRIGKAQDMAEAIIWLLSEAAGYVSGHVLTVDGGLLAGTPPARTELSNHYARKGEFLGPGGRRGLRTR